MKQFSGKIRARVKVLYIDERKTYEDISKFFGGHPSKSCIEAWAKKRDRAGKNWEDYRYEKEQEMYRNIAPSERVGMLFRRLDEIISNKVTDPARFARAVREMTSSINEIVDPRMNLPVIFQTLEDLIGYVERMERTAPKEYRVWFSGILKGFTAEVRARLEGISPPAPFFNPQSTGEPVPQNGRISKEEGVQNIPERDSR